VLPADVGTNCTALARHFPELGLCFFETEACLAYTEADLPEGLRALPVRWHMHLPLDLPWGLPGDQGFMPVAEAILALADARLSKHELSAFFRRPDHPHYRECKDQILRGFLKGVGLKYRAPLG